MKRKLVAWFTRGAYGGRAVRDIISSAAPDKLYHDHGQSEDAFRQLIERFTDSGEVVLDPFCGGGTTGPSGGSFCGAWWPEAWME